MAEHLDIDAALKQEQQRLNSRKQELETELAEINTKLNRIHRYFSDESAPSSRRPPPTPQSGNRAARGSVQTTVFELINENPEGLTRSEIITKLPDVQEQSISNALSTLVKTGRINSGGRCGKYRPVTIESSPVEAGASR